MPNTNTLIITKVPSMRWGGRYVPVSYRIDELNELGQHVKRVAVVETKKQAEQFVADYKKVENN
jgi:hypothetical protein